MPLPYKQLPLQLLQQKNFSIKLVNQRQQIIAQPRQSMRFPQLQDLVPIKNKIAMKKQIFYLLIVLVALLNVRAYGQNTGDKPAVGSTHGYWVNGIAPGTQTSGLGSTYTWWLSDSPTNLLTPVVASSD